MERTARVTVVVPTLNQARFLEAALESVASQRTPVDLIVIDGGSTDGTHAILARWQDRLAWSRSGPDAGQSSAINDGMRHSSAPYVAWLNSDDLYLEGGLDAMVEALDKAPHAPGVYADAFNVDAQGRTTSRYLTQEFTRRNLAMRCFVSQPATLMRRSAWDGVGGLDEKLHYAMDYDLWWRLFTRFGPLVRLRRPVAANRQHLDSKTQSSRRAQITEAMRIVQRHAGRVPIKWYLNWPYSVWFKSWRHRGQVQRRELDEHAVAGDAKPGGRASGGPRILIVKLAAIGDVILALPMVAAIRAAHPDAHISWMCGAGAVSLVSRVPGVDACVVVDERALLVGGFVQKLGALLGAWRKVGGRRFEAIYIAHSDARYRLLTAATLGRTRRWLGGDATHRELIQRRTHGDEYVRLVTAIDDYRAIAYDAPRPQVAMPAALATRIESFAAGRPLVAITPGGARNVARENPLRRWPLENYARLARRLGERGVAVVVLGDLHDAWVRPAFGPACLDLVGQTTLVELAAVMQRCAVVVSHDTGPLHLARLMAPRVVALFGPTPPSMFFRTDARTIPIWAGRDLPCAPCYDGVEFAHCASNVCMQRIDWRAVDEAVGDLMPPQRNR